MTTKDRTWPLAEAQALAHTLKTLLEPSCLRIEIAGSVRRQKPFVHDIELLAVPKGNDGAAWFTDMLEETMAHLVFDAGVKSSGGTVFTERPNKLGRSTYGPKNKLLVHRATGMPVDLFTTTEENWGMALVVRTGSADYCVRLMSRLRVLGCRGHAYGGITDASGVEVTCPDEETVFRLAEWDWIPPEERS